MGFKHEDRDRIRGKLVGLLSNTADDRKFIGEQGASAIVQTTLAGIGEGDSAFAPYSPAYKELIDSVGGKPRQVVDMRGIFYHKGQRRSRSKKDLGQGRRGTIKRAFGQRGKQGRFAPPKIVSFRTAETRPQRGITDPLSEMSLDLISIEVAGELTSIVYTPREKPYMIRHNEGDGVMPRRHWFTANKSAVKAALVDAATTVIKARLMWFNDKAQSGTIPPPARP